MASDAEHLFICLWALCMSTQQGKSRDFYLMQQHGWVIIKKSTRNCWLKKRRKGNPSALLVGMQTGGATVENITEFPLKINNETTFLPSDSTAENPKNP